MYLEGLGFHSIGRLLGVSHVSVLNWVRKYGRELDTIRRPRPAQMIELDELHTCVGRKKVVLGVDRNAREYMDFVIGDRSTI